MISQPFEKIFLKFATKKKKKKRKKIISYLIVDGVDADDEI